MASGVVAGGGGYNGQLPFSINSGLAENLIFLCENFCRKKNLWLKNPSWENLQAKLKF